MAKIRTLSKSSILELQRMRTRLLALEQSVQVGPRAHNDPTAHYIVSTPAGGIPAAVVGSERVAGQAVCKMFRRLTDNGIEQLKDLNRNQVVRNYSTTAIPGSTIVLAHRDAWGDMWVIPSSEACTDKPKAGSYPATVGGSIAGGASGPIVYDGTVYTAKNQSACNVIIGDLIILHVSPDCELLFTPCVCDCAQVPPAGCCDKIIAICINGEVKIVAVDGGTATWDLTVCCECDSTPTLEITLTCVTTTITAAWEYTCGATVVTGSLDYSGLCDDPVVEPVDTITPDGCSIVISASIDAEQCLPCEPFVPCGCCFDLDTFTVGANCDKSDVPATVDDVGLTAVSSATDPFCDGQTTVVTLTFTNNSGGDYGGGLDPIQVDLTSTAPTKPTCTAASDSGSITNNAGGFVVEWAMPGTWANGTTITRTFTMQNNGCTVGVSIISANVSAGRGYICQVGWTAVACP